MDYTRLKTELETRRAALPTATLTDSQLAGYYIILRDINGNIVDKQPLSRLRTMIYNHVRSKTYDIYKAIKENQQQESE